MKYPTDLNEQGGSDGTTDLLGSGRGAGVKKGCFTLGARQVSPEGGGGQTRRDLAAFAGVGVTLERGRSEAGARQERFAEIMSG